MNFLAIFHIFLRFSAILVDFGTPNGAGSFSRRACGDPLQFLLELTRGGEHSTTREGTPAHCLRFAPRRGQLETGGRRLRNFVALDS